MTPEQESTFAGLWDGFVADRVPPLPTRTLQRFAGKRIFITGAGGYLGSALVHALAALPVAQLLLLDIAEYGLYRLQEDLRRAPHGARAALVVGGVQDTALLRSLFRQHQPEIVFHAAALKHVPLMEGNAFAAAETNVLGTQALVQEATRAQVESLVFLSTDKAVSPISVMGATKRMAEQIVLDASRGRGGMQAVRLCNVLGSTGSVAPLFARQIAQGDPVTVTDADATRFFLSETDAVRHLLAAADLPSISGLLAPVVAGPHRVEELARYMMRRAANAGAEGKIVYTGLRTADKLHEQLMACSESAEVLPVVPSLRVIRSEFDSKRLAAALADVRTAVAHRDGNLLMQAIQQAVPEYRRPDEESGRSVKGRA